MPGKSPELIERRKYIRLDTVLPVQFRLIATDTGGACSDWMQGFTRNISQGGICLEMNNLCADTASLIQEKKVKLSLKIELPITKKQILTVATVAWTQIPEAGFDKYFIGLNYEQIQPQQKNLLMHYAQFKRLFIPLIVTLIALLGLGFLFNGYLNLKLIRGNKALVRQLVEIVQESSIAKQNVKDIVHQREDLQRQIQALQARMQTLSAERENTARQEEFQMGKKLQELNILIDKLSMDKNSLQEQLIALQSKESNITEDLLHLDKKKAVLEKANLDKMYHWLEIHQNPRTGLVMSFEGDDTVKDWAFIYDQALVLEAYVYFSDFDRSKKILNFFAEKAKRINGFFVNAYYASDGSVAEYTVHCGPNIWVGIGIAQYTKKTQDKRYLGLAEEIARAVISLQDEEGGIRGGPNVSWYATEHNLDAYAFFKMLYQLTGKADYQIAQEKILGWLLKHTYSRSEVPIKRGRGDSTIATDTYAWSIAAIGPEKLDALGMNPDRIMGFAEKHCCVEVVFKRPEGNNLKLKGFDFAPERNLARGGVISSEWTAQMVVSLRIMADYYYQKGLKAKGHAYEMKADEYLATLGKMVISSPSPSGQGESCLPYATECFVDTGHGWTTPRGDSTGSISGTVYALFAYYDYNPLQLQ